LSFLFKSLEITIPHLDFERTIRELRKKEKKLWCSPSFMADMYA